MSFWPAHWAIDIFLFGPSGLIKMYQILESLKKEIRHYIYTGFMHFWRRLQFCESFSEIVIHKCDRTSGCGSVRKCI